jgi:hypothetical protein
VPDVLDLSERVAKLEQRAAACVEALEGITAKVMADLATERAAIASAAALLSSVHDSTRSGVLRERAAAALAALDAENRNGKE